MAKRAGAALLITGGALALLLNFKTPEATTAIPAGNAGNGVANGSTGGTINTTRSTTGGSGTSSSTASTTSTKSGTYTGSAIQTRYGNVQVQLTISNGKITNVQVLQYPNDNPRSSSISQSTLPTLISETLQAQSAQVNSVSGATYTSQGYMQSVQSALDQAAA